MAFTFQNVMRRGLILAAVAFAAPAVTVAQTTRIPLREGLTIVTAVAESEGDYESIKRVVAAGADSVTLTYSATLPNGARASSRRIVRREDLRHAHEYRQSFNENDPASFAGTTAISASTAVLNELKTNGETTFTAMPGGLAGGAAALLGGLGNLLKSAGLGQEATAGLDLKLTGTITRNRTAMVPIIVNDQRVELPAIHAQGRLGDEETEWVVLDDTDHPLMLRFRIGNESLEVVKISFPIEKTMSTIESALKERGRVEVYGVYFDFNSDRIREESEPVLEAIADILSRNTAWTSVAVEGHTDSVGTDATNVDLSRRRAAAVKQALVDRYKIAPSRLTTAGFGAGRPIDNNDTLHGRARNRRVELALPSAAPSAQSSSSTRSAASAPAPNAGAAATPPTTTPDRAPVSSAPGSTASGAADAKSSASPPLTETTKRTACLVTKEEMQEILGEPIERVESEPSAPDTSACRYVGRGDLNAVIVKIEWSGGDTALAASGAVGNLMKDAIAGTGLRVNDPLAGLGDGASFSEPGQMAVRKGRASIEILLLLQRRARDKGIAIAEKILARM